MRSGRLALIGALAVVGCAGSATAASAAASNPIGPTMGPESASPPTSAVEIRTNSNPQATVNSNPAGTSFVITAGVHHGFTVVPKNGDRFYAQNKAVLDGGGQTNYAFTALSGGGINNVSIIGALPTQSLLIRNYADGHSANGATIQTSTVGSTRYASVHGWVVQSVEVTKSFSNGLSVSSAMAVLGSRFSSNGGAGVVGGGHIVAVENNTFDGNRGGGILLDGAGVYVTHNVVHDNGGTAVALAGSPYLSQVTGNVITNNANGVVIADGFRILVSSDIITGNRGGGVLIDTTRNVQVTSNILNRDGSGMVLRRSAHPGRGPYGPNALSAVSISVNTVIASGITGLASAVVANDGITFSGDAYQNEQFVWGGHPITFRHWQRLGQELGGSSGAASSLG